MKEGDIVRHKLSGERLKITMLNDYLVSGIWIDRPKEVPAWQTGYGQKVLQKGVCSIENVEVIK